jgi:uncharacterized membrane protein
MDHSQVLTLCLFGAIVAFVAISDVILYLRKGVNFTYSRTLLRLSREWLIVPVVVGVVVGHVFWTNCGAPKNKVECARAGD